MKKTKEMENGIEIKVRAPPLLCGTWWLYSSSLCLLYHGGSRPRLSFCVSLPVSVFVVRYYCVQVDRTSGRHIVGRSSVEDSAAREKKRKNEIVSLELSRKCEGGRNEVVK